MASSSSILFSAGDMSGDVHAAKLARKLLERDPARRLHALGGERLRDVVAQSHGEFLGDTTNCSAIGILSALKLYFRCWKLRERLRDFLKRDRVDLAVFCDWGAFNGRVLPEIHARGIPVLYYFPPSSWRRSGAGLAIVPHVARVATPFKWSAERLRAVGCDAEWVGHPVLENLPTEEERLALRQKFGTSPDETLIALLPGSRPSELRVLGPRVAAAAEILRAERALRFMAVVPHELGDEARTLLPQSIELVTDCASDLLAAADAAIVKTGTATLETAVAGVPQVAIYDLPALRRVEWVLLWAWKRIPFIAMPNIILEREAVPELTGPKCTPHRIAEALSRLLDDEAARERMRQDYALIRRQLGAELGLGATERTAQMVEEMLTKSTPARASATS